MAFIATEKSRRGWYWYVEKTAHWIFPVGRYVHNWLERSITQGAHLISLQTADNKIFAAHIQRRGGFYPHPRSCGAFALYPRPRSCGVFVRILSAVGRTGTNPIPTAAECNTLAINRLSKALQHSVNVGVGVIPTLAAACHLLFPDFVTFLLRPNTFLDNQALARTFR